MVELVTLGAVIKATYENEANTNAFTDVEKLKLAGIQIAADVTTATNVAAAGAVMDSDFTSNGFMQRTGVGTYDVVDQINLQTDVIGNISISNFNSGTNASSSTFWRGDGTWAPISSTGNVSKVGTPSDNQIGVWTGDGTIEGSNNLTWDGSVLGITGNITVSGTVDADLQATWNSLFSGSGGMLAGTLAVPNAGTVHTDIRGDATVWNADARTVGTMTNV